MKHTKKDVGANAFDKFERCFRGVGAYCIMQDRREVGTVTFHHSMRGMQHAFIHVIGSPMVHGRAGGGGYNKQRAALYGASLKLDTKHPDCAIIKDALENMDAGGKEWVRAVRDAGYDVCRVI
jgi:hypothetical protein